MQALQTCYRAGMQLLNLLICLVSSMISLNHISINDLSEKPYSFFSKSLDITMQLNFSIFYQDKIALNDFIFFIL